MDIKNKKVLIVGFGRSGAAAARYCLEQGAVVTVTDLRTAEDLKKEEVRGKKEKTAFGLPSFFSLLPSSSFYFGGNPAHLFEEADIIVPSPGVPLKLEGIKKARAKNIPVVGEMELVADKIKAPIIAITGTNGKSTVTTLIGEILKEAGKKVLVGGNLGTPLIELLREAGSRKQEAGRTDFVVLEVSSYQLEISPNFHPHIAILLNITPDHLDRYGSMQAYIDAKALITKNLTPTDHLLFNADDPIVTKIADTSLSKKISFSVKDLKAKCFKFSNEDLEGLSKCDLPPVAEILGKMKITGLHNKENMLAAIMTAAICGCEAKAIRHVAETFKGLPHRNQFVREVGGVKFYDDSKGTNVGAVIKSLEGFEEKVVLIAGGLDKGGSYEPLRQLVKEKVRALVLIGAAKEIIAKELGGLTETVMAVGMKDAVKKAHAKAKSGDAVLLSPACASFDMFKDYAERGDVFIEEVNRL